MIDVLKEMRSYLVAQGIVRNPAVAGASPPMWLAPKQGVPEPGKKMPGGDATGIGPTCVLGAYVSGGFPVGPYESAWRIPTVRVRIRGAGTPEVLDVEQKMTIALIDKRDWMMGALHVIDSNMWQALQPEFLDPRAMTYSVSYRFTVYAT